MTLRELGVSVSVLNQKGLPDLLIGYKGRNYLIELKREPGPRGGMKDRKLTPDQLLWYRDWEGQADVAQTLEEALEIIGIKVN